MSQLKLKDNGDPGSTGRPFRTNVRLLRTDWLQEVLLGVLVRSSDQRITTGSDVRQRLTKYNDERWCDLVD